MMIYVPNRGIQLLILSRLESTLPDYTQKTEAIENVLTEISESDHPPFLDFSENSGECPVEQTTEREEGIDNKSSPGSP